MKIVTRVNIRNLLEQMVMQAVSNSRDTTFKDADIKPMARAMADNRVIEIEKLVKNDLTPKLCTATPERCYCEPNDFCVITNKKT